MYISVMIKFGLITWMFRYSHIAVAIAISYMPHIAMYLYMHVTYVVAIAQCI